MHRFGTDGLFTHSVIRLLSSHHHEKHVRSHRQPDHPPDRLSVNLKGTRRSYCSFSKFDTSSPSPTTTDYVAGGLPISMPLLLLRHSKGRTSTAVLGVLMKWQKYECTNEIFYPHADRYEYTVILITFSCHCGAARQQCNGPWRSRLLIEPFPRCQ